MIDNTHKNIRFLNQIDGNITSTGVIDQIIINTRELCYQCSKHDPNFLSGKFRIRDYRYKPCFPVKRKSLSFQIQINTLFKNNDEKKEGNTIEIHIMPLELLM